MRKSLLFLILYVIMIFVASQVPVTNRVEATMNNATSLEKRQQGDYASGSEKNQDKASQTYFKGYDFGDVTELSYIEK